MISVTRLNGTHFFVNAELIKYIEATPDTVITLTDDTKLIVREAAAAVARAVVEYHRQVLEARQVKQGETA